jgi:serine/threonine-protein kinase
LTAALPEYDATLAADELDALVTRTLAELPRERLDAFTRTALRNPKATIQPETARSDALGRAALAELGTAAAVRDVGASVVLEQTLGEGGMGVVRLATQRSLGRKVAVKTLKPDVLSEQAILRLLREAWVTGSLEHPNIVPVYDLGLDERGAPIIVLKRIEGDAWSELLADPASRAAHAPGADPLEQNLRILVQLCHAVALAHARGVLHRDLKPENVMIGSFGEVYLVDWGVAVALREDPSGRLPVGSGSEMAGTPVYMAPEMLGVGSGAPLSERTDVYLLGAILHELLTGRPPHDGSSFRAIVASILQPRPQYPDDAPRELVAIAQKAMRFEPSERFASADELRARIEWYLRHRSSLALSEEASKSLALLTALAGAPPGGGARDQIYRLFAEARFGFRQALVASSDNEAAARGLEEAITSVVAWELAHGTAEAAASAVAELRDAPLELRARVEAAREAQASRVARLTALERDLDPSIGRRTRAFVALVMGALWTTTPLLLGHLEARYGALEPRSWYAFSVFMIGVTFAVTHWARESLLTSLVNRRVIAIARLTFALQLSLELVSTVMKVSHDAALVLHLFVWFASASTFAVFFERRLWPTAIGYFICMVLGAMRPDLYWSLAALGNLVMLLNATLSWRARGDLAFAADRFRRRRARRTDRDR